MHKLTGHSAIRSPGAPSLWREIERRFWLQIASGTTSETDAEKVGVSTVAVATLAFMFPNLMVSSWPVVKAHTAIADDCFACHVPLRGVSAGLCVGYHAVNDIGRRASLGQKIFKAKAKAKVAFHQPLQETNCMACHTDHTSPRLNTKA